MTEYQYVQDAEFGITGGVAHYFGDLNNHFQINRPKAAIGGFYRKQFGNYIAARLAAHYLQLGYSDRYNKSDFEKARNLSFNTNVFEVTLQGDFNFFKFIPSDPNHAFTPYVTLGVGIFSYDPYAMLEGEKYYLRPLHTEGQTFYQNRKPYGTMALCFPLGFGMKYAFTDNLSVSFELGYRFTGTDYLDDVSTTYVGIDKFPAPGGGKNVAALLQDRSYEFGTPIGIEGRQRGWSKQKDHYMIAEVGLSLSLTSYRCPDAR
ncbi:MAG: outer membrane beta-barrel protein [Chitinophagaceae bacterium]|nr:outer membrane beta-barrel protein [Chitinophagaceae bacterium]